MSPAGYIAPMKPLNLGRVPKGVWLCEVKFDGYRALAILRSGKAGLWSRNRRPLGPEYPEVVGALERIRCDSAAVDGELVALDAAGRSRFQLLQNRASGGERPRIVYYAFDLLEVNGTQLLGEPLVKRRKRLETLLRRAGPAVQLSPAFAVAPAKLLAAAKRRGLEGIVAKRPDSAYEPGRRTGAWVKCKVVSEQEFVVGGFTAPRRSREHFGSLLLGYYKKRALVYAGKVGTGFDGAQLRSLHELFRGHRLRSCPFTSFPELKRNRWGAGFGPSERARVTWLRPALVAQIRFAEWTDEGLLRQPVFLGLRNDKAASAVVHEPGPA